jgi:hypothetical protein
LLGMLAAPIRSFMYILDQKAKMGAKNDGGSAVEPAAPETPTSNDTESPEQKVELTQAQ